jgi:NAD-dependent dihydropyrimidine dehydrogenase PreA subunit
MRDHDAQCSAEAGAFKPVIDRDRCEGKEACVPVCPYLVFSMDAVAPQDRRGLTLAGKVKGFVHRWRQTFATNAQACQACDLYGKVCPEQVITLERV